MGIDGTTFESGPRGSGSFVSGFEVAVESHLNNNLVSKNEVQSFVQKYITYDTVYMHILGKIFASLIFEVLDESAKATKIMYLENLALYGMLIDTVEWWK